MSDATPKQVQEAQQTFREADKLFDVQKYDQAIAKYRESYQIVASPNSRLMIARSLRELGRLAEAFREYEATVEAAEQLAENNDAYATTAAAARDELQALRSRVAWLTIELGDVPEGSAIKVAGRAVDVAELDAPLVVVPGRTDVVATTTDGHVAKGEVHLAAGGEGTLTLKLDETVTVGEPAETEPEAQASPPPEPTPTPAPEEPPPRRRRPSPLAYVAGGVGVIGFTAFGVFGRQAKSKFDDLESRCPDDACPPDAQTDIDSGRTAQTLANVGLAVGVVGVVTSATLFVARRRGGRETKNASVRLSVAPTALALEGRFR